MAKNRNINPQRSLRTRLVKVSGAVVAATGLYTAGFLHGSRSGDSAAPPAPPGHVSHDAGDEPSPPQLSGNELPQQSATAEQPVRERVMPEKKDPFHIPFQPRHYLIKMNRKLLPYLRYGETYYEETTGRTTRSVYLDTNGLIGCTSPDSATVQPFIESRIELVPAEATGARLVLQEPESTAVVTLFGESVPAPLDIVALSKEMNAIHKRYDEARERMIALTLTPEQSQARAENKSFPLNQTQRTEEMTLQGTRLSEMNALLAKYGSASAIDRNLTRIDILPDRMVMLPEGGSSNLGVTALGVLEQNLGAGRAR